jgi:DNA-binding SARP family transcriptional activator
MQGLRLYYLGAPRIELDGRELRPGFRKALALLIYLTLAKEGQRRESLMNLLWPDHAESKARASLRHAVYSIRKLLPDAWLVADRHEVGILDEQNVWCDVAEFQNAVSRAAEHEHTGAVLCDECRIRLERAVELYRGDFLKGFGLRDSENFDDWQFFQAEGLRQDLSNALEQITYCYIDSADYQTAQVYARKWISLDRLNEVAHRSLMRIAAWSGNRAAAIRQYDDCVSVLADELAVAPQHSTRLLFEAIRDDRIEAPASESKTTSQTDLGRADSGSMQLVLEEPGVEKRYVTTIVLGLRRTDREAGLAAIRAFQISAQAVIARYGGIVNSTHAERIVAFFGGEQTRENDPDLALCAALEIGTHQTLGSHSISAGVSTGWAYFAGDTAAGNSLALASRFYEKAQPGCILIDEAAYRHTRLVFETREESAEPGRCFVVIRRLAAAGTTMTNREFSSPLVGRTRDVADLKDAARKWLGGQGQVALISGEAGIGKSRLASEVITLARAENQQVLCLEGRCVSSDHPITYWPFLDILRSYFGLRDTDSNVEVLRKISTGVRLLNVPSESATTAYLCNLLSVRLSASSAKELEQKSPDQIREGTLENLLNLIEHIGRRTKLLLVLEDLHWADDLSFELLALLLDSLPSSAVFIVCLFRPESGHRTAQLSMIARRKCFDRCTEIQLHRLSTDETQRLVEHQLGGAQPSRRAAEYIVEKSEGVPFFVEEIIRSLIEESILAIRAGSWELDGSASEVDVPDSIQNVISARLGLLSAEDRAFLRYAAVVGRFFKLRLVAHRLGNSGGLEERIRVCSERDLIYAERTVPEAEYAFCHAFTQEATYEEIPEETRIQFHRQVATDIERLYEDRIEEWYETLAFHYSRGDDVDGAIDFLIKAGQKAIRRTDSQAAIALLRRGLEFVERMEDTERRRSAELEYRIVLGGALAVAQGYGATEVADNYDRVRELCLEADSTPHLFEALHGLTGYYLVKGDLRVCSDLAVEQLRHAQHLGRSEYQLEASLAVGLPDILRGRLQCGRPYIERTLSLYDIREHEHLAFLYGHDPAVAAYSQLPMGLWAEGYPDRAREMCVRCIDFAHEKNHPPSLAMAYALVPITYHLLREPESVLRVGGEIFLLSQQFDVPLWHHLGSIICASANGEIEKLGQLIEASESSGLNYFGSFYSMLHAHLIGTTRSVEEGLDALGRAQAKVEKSDERIIEPEIHRMRGEFLVKKSAGGRSDSGDATPEECFRHSLDIAENMGARTLALRTATSLARLMRDQNRKTEARSLVETAYARMTEGFDTRDLIDAQDLIGELS